MEESQQSLDDIRVDTANLYREESITDLRVASIRRMIPIRPDGSRDESRSEMFVGQTHIMSQMGPLPVQCEIEAAGLEEAMAKFPEAIQQAIEDMIEEAKEQKQQESSRIVVPGAMPSGLIGGGGGVPPGGGKIHLG